MKMQKKKIKYHHLKIIIINQKKNEYIFHRNRKRV